MHNLLYKTKFNTSSSAFFCNNPNESKPELKYLPLDKLISELVESSNSGGRSVELGDLVLLAHGPEAVVIREERSTFKL